MSNTMKIKLVQESEGKDVVKVAVGDCPTCGPYGGDRNLIMMHSGPMLLNKMRFKCIRCFTEYRVDRRHLQKPSLDK